MADLALCAGSGARRKLYFWELILNEPQLILGVGELLWDLLPEGARLGGAPANFSVMAGRLGNHAMILSRVGDDALGEKALDVLRPLSVDTSALQMDARVETGRVTVEFKDGQPSYVIHQPAAWDCIAATEEWLLLAERADAICFGSLAQRSDEARKVIEQLVEASGTGSVRVFDVNLREPFYSAEVLRSSIGLATVVKMNDAEVPLVLGLLGLAGLGAHLEGGSGRASLWDKYRLRVGAEKLLAEYPRLDLVAITCGGSGSLLVRRDEWNDHAGIPVVVADTIGAGDAFTAAMTHYLLKGASLARLNEAGNRWGGYVASQNGAMPEISNEVMAEMRVVIEESVD